jgi:hypothetical protein
MRRRHSDEFPISMIEVMQVRIVWELGVASLHVLLYMRVCHSSRISRILKQPFQESIANAVPRVWFGFLAVFIQNLVSVVEDNATLIPQMLEYLDTRNDTSRRNIGMLAICDKQDVCINHR